MKRIKLSLIIVMLLASLTAVASEPYSPLPTIPVSPIRPRVTCEEVLQKCDAALAARNKQIEKLELGLTKQTERVADLSSQLEDKNQQLQAWYRNPFVVFSLGLVAGAAVITFAQ